MAICYPNQEEPENNYGRNTGISYEGDREYCLEGCSEATGGDARRSDLRGFQHDKGESCWTSQLYRERNPTTCGPTSSSGQAQAENDQIYNLSPVNLLPHPVQRISPQYLRGTYRMSWMGENFLVVRLVDCEVAGCQPRDCIVLPDS